MVNIKKYIPRPTKYVLIGIYVGWKCLTKGPSSQEIVLNLSGVLPPIESKKIIHGGKVKLLHLRERFGDSWKRFNVAYFVSSGLPFAPAIWIKIYKFFGVKVVWNQNGFAYPALYTKEVVNNINNLMKPIRYADYVVYQTEFTKRCTEKFLGKTTNPSSIIINPVDAKHFRPRPSPLPIEPLVIIMAGNHFESKERMTASLTTIKILNDKGTETKLIIIGKIDRTVEEEIENLGLSKLVEIRGEFLQLDAPKLFQDAHILLHLKYLDPCPTIVLEALSCGLPVVASMSGGLPEMVDSQSGILIPIKEDFDALHYPSPDTVADSIIKIKQNLIQYSHAARAGAVIKFDKEIWLARHQEIFGKLLRQ